MARDAREVRQKDIRALLRNGNALPLSEAKSLIDKGEAEYYDFENVLRSFGTYGINGLCIEHKETGQLYADASRSSLAFYFFS